VRQHKCFSHAFRCAGKHTKRALPVTALALRTRWHRPINLPSSAYFLFQPILTHAESLGVTIKDELG